MGLTSHTMMHGSHHMRSVIEQAQHGVVRKGVYNSQTTVTKYERPVAFQFHS